MKITNLISYYKQHGLLSFIKRSFASFGFEFFDRAVIFILLDMNNLKSDVNELYSFREATIADVQQAEDYNENWFTKEEAIQRILDGHRLFVLKINDKIVYYAWADVKNITIYYLDMNFNIPASMVYITGCYTRPECRGKGFAYQVKKEVLNFLKKEGIKHAIGVVDPINKTALKIHKEIGFREYQTITYKRYGYLRHYIVQKYDGDERKSFFTLFKAPDGIWKTFCRM